MCVIIIDHKQTNLDMLLTPSKDLMLISPCSTMVTTGMVNKVNLITSVSSHVSMLLVMATQLIARFKQQLLVVMAFWQCDSESTAVQSCYWMLFLRRTENRKMP